MMEELEHSDFLSDEVIDKIAKLFTLSFSELNYVETILSIWYNGTEYLCFSLKLGDVWIHTTLETEAFIGTDLGTGYDLIKEKPVKTIKNDLRFKAFLKLDKINEDFK